MEENMNRFQQCLIEHEYEAEQLLLARHQYFLDPGTSLNYRFVLRKAKNLRSKDPDKLVENDRLRNGNREALTALRKRARTTKTSIPLPFESLMKEVEGLGTKPLVREVCTTCGNHDTNEKMWMTFPGSDLFARVPFHAAHTILEKDQERLDFDSKKLQSLVKEKSLLLSEKGALADKVSPGVLRSLVSLTDAKK